MFTAKKQINRWRLDDNKQKLEIRTKSILGSKKFPQI